MHNLDQLQQLPASTTRGYEYFKEMLNHHQAASDTTTITEVTDTATRGDPADGQQPSSTVGITTNDSSGSPNGPVQRVTTEVDTLARREEAPTRELRITRRGLLSVGHCLACHSENRAHHGHIYGGDCLRLGASG